ncbi:MAG: hypothetical protein WCH34_12555 [Bacteroidota bacterium]
MKSDWSYLVNPILNATKGNYAKALRISIYHYSALYARRNIPFFLALYNLYSPLHLTYVNAYEEWMAEVNMKEGNTLRLKQLLVLLRSNKIKAWDISIQNIYDNTTKKYKSLLPNKRKPFQKGKQLLRIEEVKILSKSIGNDALLAEVKADIDLTYEQLKAAASAQKSSKTNTFSKKKALETARVAMCTMQYANLGALIQQMPSKPRQIAAYFDLKAIRKHHQVLVKGHVKPLVAKFIRKHTFGIRDQIKISNIGKNELQFYLAQFKGNKPPTPCLNVAPGTIFVGLASILGDLSNKILMLHNPHDVEGKYIIEFL